MVQWLRLHAPNAEATGSILGQGTKSHMHYERFCMPRLKPNADEYINIEKKRKKANSICIKNMVLTSFIP